LGGTQLEKNQLKKEKRGKKEVTEENSKEK